MENEITLTEIINSNFISNLIDQDNKDLEEAGWSYEEVKQVAKIVTTKTK